MLGIGICTYNRRELLATLVGQLRRYTQTEYRLVVADGGSTDGTPDWCAAEQIPVIRGKAPSTIGATKNRALYYLLHRTDCRPLLLLEDDVGVWEAGWEAAWLAAAARHGRIDWTSHLPEPTSEADGTWARPWRLRPDEIEGACSITTRDLLERVGYLDPRFGRYGWDYIEWAERCARALNPAWDPLTGTVAAMNAHVGVGWDVSSFSKAELDANQRIYDRVQADPTLFRNPWRTAAQQRRFLADVEAAE